MQAPEVATRPEEAAADASERDTRIRARAGISYKRILRAAAAAAAAMCNDPLRDLQRSSHYRKGYHGKRQPEAQQVRHA